VRICPVSGPGSLNKFELKRRVKEIIAEFDANSETVFKQAEAVNLGTTFKEQAERWLQTVQTRKRNPIKPRTAAPSFVVLETPGTTRVVPSGRKICQWMLLAQVPGARP
jgi:hypothetical protein